MKLLKRHLSTIYYLLYSGKVAVLDDDGYETGETTVGYADPVKLICSVSSASGEAQTEMFGNLESYDKALITDDTSCPIDEDTVLFVDKEPEYDEDGKPLYDYTVKRVAKSLNFISYAIAKAETS